MGSVFSSPPPVVVSTPHQSATQGSTEVQPYTPVVPYIKDLLPRMQQQFGDASPELYTGSLVPGESYGTSRAHDIYGTLGQTATGLANTPLDFFNRDAALAVGDIFQDPLHLARTGVIADQARRLTERDQELARKQAMDAGQYGLGSTALRELETNQQIRREELARNQLSASLQAAEDRRIAAQGRVPAHLQSHLQTLMVEPSLQEGIGQRDEAREAALRQDAARLAQQRQEAERAQMVTYANLLGGLAGLGSATQMQQTTRGTGSQILPGGPSPLSTMAGLIGAAAPMFPSSDIRLKSDIKFVGKLVNGVKLYTWKWNKKGKEIAGNQIEFGVLAQQAMKIVPEAVLKGNDGYFRVNYSKLGI